MSLVSLNVSDLIVPDWRTYDKERKTNWSVGLTYIPATTIKWNKDDTYLIIFGDGDDALLKIFKENCGGFNILFETPKCSNTVHPGSNRNTLIVFEVDLRFFENYGEGN